MIPISQVTDFKTGDIYITKCTYPIIQHHAIAFYRDGVPSIADMDDSLQVFTLDDYKKKRTILGIIRNDKTLAVTDAQVENAIVNYNDSNYSLLFKNCQDFVYCIVNGYCPDQRVIGAFIALSIILITLIILQ